MTPTHKFELRGQIGYKEGHYWVIWNALAKPDDSVWSGGAQRVTDPSSNARLDGEAVAVS